MYFTWARTWEPFLTPRIAPHPSLPEPLAPSSSLSPTEAPRPLASYLSSKPTDSPQAGRPGPWPVRSCWAAGTAQPPHHLPDRSGVPHTAARPAPALTYFYVGRDAARRSPRAQDAQREEQAGPDPAGRQARGSGSRCWARPCPPPAPNPGQTLRSPESQWLAGKPSLVSKSYWPGS